MMQAPNLVVDRFLFPSHKFHNSDILIDILFFNFQKEC